MTITRKKQDEGIVATEVQNTVEELLLKGVECNDLQMVQEALLKGADFNKQNKYGMSPYRIATDYKQNPEIVQALITQGADVNDQSLASKFTPLHEAAHKCNKPLMELLIECGADLNRQSQNGKTPLHSICDNQSICQKESVLIDTAEFLIKKEANINIVDNEGNTPLRWAAYWGHKNLAKMLIKQGALCQNTQNFIRPSPISYGNRNVGKFISTIITEIQHEDNSNSVSVELKKTSP